MVAPRRRLLALLLLGLLLAEPATTRRAKKPAASKKPPPVASGSAGGPPPGMTPQIMAKLRPLMDAAEGYASSGQKQPAIEQYLAALRVFPDFDMAHYNLGVTFEETGQFEESSVHYRHTLGLLPSGDPRRIDVLSRLGQLSARLGGLLTGPQHVEQRTAALEEAEALLTEAVDLQPRGGDPTVRFAIGKVLSELGKGKKAIKQLSTALRAAPNHPPMQLQLGLALSKFGGKARAAEAREILDGALQADNADWHAQVGLQLREEMPERARVHFERALDIDPNHSQATSTYYRLGAMYHLLGIWKSVHQRAGYFAAGVAHQAAWPNPEGDRWVELGDAMRLLEVAHGTIQAEFLAAAGVQPGGVLDLAQITTGVDNENLTDSGQWSQRIYMRNGLPLFEAGETGAAGFEAAFPQTVAAVRDALQQAGSEGLPKGSVEFSILDEGTHIKPHCGPSNHKWRLHLGVVVPSGCSIRVGDPTAESSRRPWEEGKVILFDDSYEHEIFHEGQGEGPRVVLIVDVWHPEVADERSREQVRKDFAWHAARDSLLRSGLGAN